MNYFLIKEKKNICVCPLWRSENPSQKLKTIVIKKLLLHVLENLDFVNERKLMSLFTDNEMIWCHWIDTLVTPPPNPTLPKE